MLTVMSPTADVKSSPPPTGTAVTGPHGTGVSGITSNLLPPSTNFTASKTGIPEKKNPPLSETTEKGGFFYGAFFL